MKLKQEHYFCVFCFAFPFAEVICTHSMETFSPRLRNDMSLIDARETFAIIIVFRTRPPIIEDWGRFVTVIAIIMVSVSSDQNQSG